MHRDLRLSRIRRVFQAPSSGPSTPPSWTTTSACSLSPCGWESIIDSQASRERERPEEVRIAGVPPVAHAPGSPIRISPLFLLPLLVPVLNQVDTSDDVHHLAVGGR